MTKRIVITYGTYDLLHHGHIKLLERAKELGDYLIVGVTSDQYDKERGKLNVSQSTLERVDAVRALGIADKIIIEEYEGQKIADIKKYNVDVFTVGSDWRGYFDYLKEYCDVVYLDRTKGISSTQLRSDAHGRIKAGIFGCDRFAKRLWEEGGFVGGIEFVGYCPPSEYLVNFFSGTELKKYTSPAALLEDCDASFIFSTDAERTNLINLSIDAGCHTWFASPGFLSTSAAIAARDKALSQNLLLAEGARTAFLPAFEHLELVVGSGKIGTVLDVSLSCTQNIDHKKNGLSRQRSSFIEWSCLGMLPIVKILGSDWHDISFSSRHEDGLDYFTRCNICYPSASATLCTGTGVKTENDLTITGTKGFIYVPAPWWKTDYFEIRYEDLRDTKKIFYQYAGEGLRHGILEFVRAINQGLTDIPAHPFSEVIAETRILEAFSMSR